MVVRKKLKMLAALYGSASLALTAAPVAADLQSYVSKPEPVFEWRTNKKIATPSGDHIYDLRFVSQAWQGDKWRHQLQVYQPMNAAPGTTMFLWVTGGNASPEAISLGLEVARKIKAPVAFVYDVPNQPLLGNLREDDLIAETFVRYLKSQDENWPLLLPMVKSVVKSMDVLQIFGKNEWSASIGKFIVAGASKRGWTTWLTAAVDKRVAAIAPVVIDVLNMRAQMPRQLQAFGAYSSRLAAYSSRGLLPIPDTPAGKQLLSMVDPWAYRDKLTMPKLIINGTNDFYWATDALNLYWDGIPKQKWVVYVPNAGHNLRRQDRPQNEQLNDLITSLVAFSRHHISGKPMPQLRWKHEVLNGKLRLTVDAEPPPLAARLWTADAATMDFRASQWREQEMSFVDGKIIGEVTPPADRHVALFGELDYDIDGVRYQLSTQVQTSK